MSGWGRKGEKKKKEGGRKKGKKGFFGKCKIKQQGLRIKSPKRKIII